MPERVLITGGSGTLGKAFIEYNRHTGGRYHITAFARSESRLAELKRRYPEVHTIIGDVRDPVAVRQAVVGHDGVIHAAAMKRIPECEDRPSECIATNVVGSENVALACVLAGIKWCVGLSTDKACSAVTTYGASKLIMEGIFQAWAARCNTHETRFFLVRYGNVVASNGSVVPLWADQAKRNEPLSLTHKDMTRFWMSPFDAVQTILLAIARGEPGTVYIPKMRALKLAALAQALHPDSPIDQIGLRSKEKVHEDLVAPNEQALEYTDYFLLSSKGSLGHTYCSRDVADLPVEKFMAMLDNAQKLEHP